MLNYTLIHELIDFEHTQIFNHATNYTGIFSFVKSVKGKHDFIYRSGFMGAPTKIDQSELSESPWVFLDQQAQEIINKIKDNITLGAITKISEGVVTGLNYLYLKRRDEIKENKFGSTYFFPCFRGKEIDKYCLKPPSELLFYPYELVNGKTVLIDESVLRQKVPNYLDYLRQNVNLINNRKYFAESNKRWYELWNQRNICIFKSQKIITPELSDKNRFMIAHENIFYGDTVCGITVKEDFKEEFELKYLLALLNSHLIEWLYKKTTVPKAGGFFIYKVMYLSNIPIRKVSIIEQQPLIEIVDRILYFTKDNDYLDNPDEQAKVKKLEEQIDKLVYELYELTPEEIEIVEAFNKEK